MTRSADVGMIWQGELLHIHVASTASAAMHELAEATLVGGVGIEGDRYATGLGTSSKRPHINRQVTLIEVEVLEAIARDRGIALAPQRAQAQPDDSRRAARASGGALFPRWRLRALRRAAECPVPLFGDPAWQEGLQTADQPLGAEQPVVRGGMIRTPCAD